jgi:GNAT superfamily N-acetyltransferase
MSRVEVRPARDQELDAAGAAVRKAYEVAHFVPEYYLDTLGAARDRAEDSEITVAVLNGQVVGSVTFALPGSRWAELTDAPGEAEFRMLGVLPQAQGRGAGRALVQWCIARARHYNCQRLLLSSQPQMAAAHHLYKDLGFVRCPDLDFTPQPGVRLHAYVLELTED